MKAIEDIPGMTCVKPKGAFYCFPKLDMAKFNLHDDMQFAYDFLREKHVLIVQGTADEVVPYEAVRGFADRNGLRILSVEGADHRFLDPAKMDIVLNSFMEHLGI